MVRFQLYKVNTEQFAILAENAPQPNAKVTMETNLYFKAATNGERLASDVKFTFMVEKAPFLVIEASCEFNIHPEDWKAMLDGNSVVIPKETLEYLAMQTIGTTRGILHCKTEGTDFNKYMIPPINASAMIKGDMTISIKKED